MTEPPFWNDLSLRPRPRSWSETWVAWAVWSPSVAAALLVAGLIVVRWGH
jgi:hypothetical protein